MNGGDHLTLKAPEKNIRSMEELVQPPTLFLRDEEGCPYVKIQMMGAQNSRVSAPKNTTELKKILADQAVLFLKLTGNPTRNYLRPGPTHWGKISQAH